MANPPASSRSGPTGETTTTLTIQYQPVAEIGAGGMGSVVLAKALTGPRSGSYVAIKRLYPHLEHDPEVVNAFLDEVWLISSLHHPNVVEPFDWGRDDKGSYLAMQFVPGDSLRALVRAREAAQDPLPIHTIVEIIAYAAAGLQAAHDLHNEKGQPVNLVHRDVSPANVLVGYEGSVKLIDFGVAKAIGKMVSTEHGLIKGKYGYMSPEQMRGEPLDRRSDIFSLGVLAWELLTLCRLYNASSEFESYRLISDEEPVAPSELRRDVPPELDRIVLRCLAKKSARRYATCAELLRELKPLRLPEGEGRHAIASAARESMPERLQWIEQVTGRRIERIESAIAGGAHRTDDAPGEHTEREVPAYGGASGASVPVAPAPRATAPAGEAHTTQWTGQALAPSPGAPSPGAPSPGAPSPGAPLQPPTRSAPPRTPSAASPPFAPSAPSAPPWSAPPGAPSQSAPSAHAASGTSPQSAPSLPSSPYAPSNTRSPYAPSNTRSPYAPSSTPSSPYPQSASSGTPSFPALAPLSFGPAPFDSGLRAPATAARRPPRQVLVLVAALVAIAVLASLIGAWLGTR